MMGFTNRLFIYCATFGMALGACDVVEPSTAETSTAEQPGITMQGITMQGITMQGMNMLGYRIDGATLSGAPLAHVRVERGELVAEQRSVTLRGTQLNGAHLQAEVRDLAVSPPERAIVEYRITAITPELPQYDPTRTGNTFLYTLEQRVDDSDTWKLACPADTDGRSAAIPLTGTWDEHGDLNPARSMFTFGCTTGVIAKCYRWGYRPWVTGYGDLTTMHWTCTRLARADYCGIGVPHTRNGTTIDVWDTLPRPIQSRDPRFGMVFEAGWNTSGAVCLSRSRWLLDDGLAIAALCPDRLVPPGLGGLGGTVCNTVADVFGYDPDARMFNESFLNVVPTL